MVEIIGDDLHIPLPVNAGVAASDTGDIPDDLPESVISLRQRIHYKIISSFSFVIVLPSCISVLEL